ncbi:MAG TPA: hypothetical protein VMG60_09260 [Burkholderiaceae bacterium]|nr:hypothetical protein [Burkholderiaceae bacterium]
MAPRTASQAHELRVLEGAQHGARAALAAGVGCVLASHPDGHAEGADVVLREEGAAPVRVRVTVDLRDALIEVLEGEVHLGDQTLTAGTQAAWAMHAPLRIGRSVVAFGRAGSTGWPAAAAAAPDETHAESASAVARKLRTPMSRRPETWLAAMGGLVLLICGAAFGTAHFAAAAPAPENPQVPSLAAALRNSEFSTLRTGARKDGQLDLFGRLDTIDQRARLDAWLAEHQFNTAVDVQVDEALARDVTETFRVNGVAVQAQVLGAGTVSVETAEPDAARLARAEEVVRRDVRGLTKLAVQNTAKPPKKPLPPMTDDPGKRIASLVPGDPAYIVTADGSRYFVGSMLPSGHRIAAIGSNSVTLENDGETTTLNF